MLDQKKKGQVTQTFCVLKEKIEDTIAVKQIRKRKKTIKTEVEKYGSFESKEKLPESEDVLKALALKYNETGDLSGQFAIAQKLHENFDNSVLLVKCYGEKMLKEYEITEENSASIDLKSYFEIPSFLYQHPVKFKEVRKQKARIAIVDCK